jgi:catechol 2,3-dioxygenase-like lactoylglutathione lyase family enzyme
MTVPAQPITGVDFVFVPTRDFARAERFYGEVLGLPALSRYSRVPGGEFEAGNLTLQVVESASIGRGFRSGGGAIALHVDDVHAARAQLEARGVRFSAQTIDTGVCHMAPFADPDGNEFLLHRRYAPRD